MWIVFEPILFFLCQKEKNGFNLPRKERGLSKPEVHLVPPSRQKKPAPFRFRRPDRSEMQLASSDVGLFCFHKQSEITCKIPINLLYL